MSARARMLDHVDLPDIVRWMLATAMAAVTIYHVGRLTSRRRPVDVDILHAAMGAVMTVVLMGHLGAAAAGLAGTFAVGGVWFGRRAVLDFVMDGNGATPARQVVACAAMSYMLIAMSATPPMPGMTMHQNSSPILVGAAALAALTVAAIARPRLAVASGCQLAMSATTVLMLLAL